MAHRGLIAAVAGLLLVGCDAPAEHPATAEIPTAEGPVAESLAAEGSLAEASGAEGSIVVQNARVLDPRTSGRASFYVHLGNPTESPDTLLAIEVVGAGEGSLHEMSREGGIMRMSPVAGVAIPAQGLVDLSPGALHGMFEGITASWSVGDSIDVTMHFARAPPQMVRAVVVSPADAR